ncbi:hypothetical protein CFOL_v3_23309 [Cephalotus follicularis]|uniref:UBN2 domain-containing protein n=1 Tax=Cephalotus follicularis TaxID=3775 RepID=A0A1Q3CHW8_CEPFO|nr:hypothetical protein CFOL_v3_23309 [Cephalotus follicularis]
MKTRFSPSKFNGPRATIERVRHKSSVLEYQNQFKAIINRIIGLSNEFIINFFIVGLEANLRHEMLTLQPTSLDEAIGVVKMYEERLADLQLSTKNNTSAISKPCFVKDFQYSNIVFFLYPQLQK